ncbi:MAG: hypothetical protein SF187_28805 [Deltaproteobacteria bacterium]|nr:hypothetical protein [Deltaproteobacteria bacterium]
MKMIHLTGVFCVAAAGVCGAGMAHAANTWRPSPHVRTLQEVPEDPITPPRLSLELFGNTAFVKDNAYRLVSSDRDIGGGGAAAMFRFWAPGRVGLSGRIEIAGEDSRGGTFEGTTKYESSSLGAGLMLDVTVYRYLHPYVQVTGGRSTAEINLYGVGSSNLRASDSVLYGTGAAGLRFVTQPKRWWTGGRALAFSVYVEGGYTLAPDFSFEAKLRSVPEGDIPAETLPLGGLERKRAHSRLGVAVHF